MIIIFFIFQIFHLNFYIITTKIKKVNLSLSFCFDQLMLPKILSNKIRSHAVLIIIQRMLSTWVFILIYYELYKHMKLTVEWEEIKQFYFLNLKIKTEKNQLVGNMKKNDANRS